MISGDAYRLDALGHREHRPGRMTLTPASV